MDDLLRTADANDAIRAGILENKTAARQTFGSTHWVGLDQVSEVALSKAKDLNIIPRNIQATDIAEDMGIALSDLKGFKQYIRGLGKTAEGRNTLKNMEKALPRELSEKLGFVGETGTAYVRKVMAGGGEVLRSDLPTGITAEIFESNEARLMLQHIAEKTAANPNNPAWKLLNFTVNTMPSNYEKIDQSYKLASFIRSTVDGYSVAQVRKIAHLIDLDPEDMIKVAIEGEWRYKLPAHKALELSNVLYMNYAAMPAAIRVLRNFPILGSPFSSFMFAMALKTGQTLAYNPAAFTQINFAINDFGGQKTPIEKEALKKPYYSYLKRTGMFRMPFPFFGENPVYLNLANMIPFYSFNMFNPSERDISQSALPEKLVAYAQKLPIMKDPVGSTLFDYLIQPLILQDTIAPKGQFGQPLYPVDAGIGTKALYGARAFTESFVPGIAAAAGFIPIPESAIEAIPLYRWRTLARARLGQDVVGRPGGKESAESRTFRSAAGILGVPVQPPVNITFGKPK